MKKNKPLRKNVEKKSEGILDFNELRKIRQPEFYTGKSPPKPKMDAPNLINLTDTNKMLEVLILWNNAPVQIRRFKPGKKVVSIGCSRKVDFNISKDLIVKDKKAFIIPVKNSFLIVPSKEMLVTLETKNGNTTAISSPHLLGLYEKAVIRIGKKTEFHIRFVSEEKRISAGLFSNVDYTMMSSSLLSIMLVIVAVAAIMMFAPKIFKAGEAKVSKSPEIYFRVKFKSLDKKIEKVENGKAKNDQKSGMNSNASSKNKNKSRVDRQKEINSELLRALDTGGVITNVFGAGGLGVGINSALSALHGTRMTAVGGLGGLGSRGAGAGGGGNPTGIGSIGLGFGDNYSGNYAAIKIRGSGKTEMQVPREKIELKGSMDKSEIQRVVRRHYSQIKYCYEKELAKNPNLYGKVTTNWTIGPDGRVQNAHIVQTDINNIAVEDCIVRNIKHWRFLKPKGGGIVIVTYPFLFHSGG